VDTTKFAEGAKPDAYAAEVAKIKKANEYFKTASATFKTAAATCSAFRARFADDRERGAILDRDVKSFQSAGDLMAAVSRQVDGSTLPTMESVHQVMIALSDMMTYSRARAEAHRGMPGHYPTRAVKF
jgi:hypothetical protein